MIDVFVPTMMHGGVTHSDWSWFRTLAILQPGVRVETVREKLQPVMQAFHEERAKGFKTESKLFLDRFLNQKLLLDPASSALAGMQTEYRRLILVLRSLIGMILLFPSVSPASPTASRAATHTRANTIS